ncbi:alpha/beta hydrolase-fold protein [soil metagenome]
MSPLNLLVACCLISGVPSEERTPTALRFEVKLAPGLVTTPQDGRLLIVLGQSATPEPRRSIGRTGVNAPPLMGKDARGLTPDGVVVFDRSAVIFPIRSLDDLPKGKYFAQAVLMTNRDLKMSAAPGNLYSEPVEFELDPKAGGTHQLTLSKAVPAEKLPEDSERNKYLKFKSELLSRFHGRPMYLRVGIRLPAKFASEPDRQYPLRISIGGYGSRFTGIARADASADQMIVMQVDGAGPYGDPNQVNSANNGPFGDALTQELIPHIEKQYRGLAKPDARFLTGTSTGGWVSLALQVFYPDFFGGCWSCCPDPVDFHCFQLVNIYDDANAFVNRSGFDRPGMRNTLGDMVESMHHQIQIENVLGDGDSWTRSGQQWGSWNASFSPRGSDGQPIALWDPKTGVINKSVLEHWKKYDLHRVLAGDWKTRGPKLQGKIRIWAGEADQYFLNNAVHLLDGFLSKAQPPFQGHIAYGMGKGHGWKELNERQINEQMLDIARRKAGAK